MNQRSLIAANKDKRNLFVAGILALVLPLYIFNSNIVSNFLLGSWFDYKNGRTIVEFGVKYEIPDEWLIIRKKDHVYALRDKQGVTARVEFFNPELPNKLENRVISTLRKAIGGASGNHEDLSGDEFKRYLRIDKSINDGEVTTIFNHKNGLTLEFVTDVEYVDYVIGNRLVVSAHFDRRLIDTKYLDFLIDTFQSPGGLRDD